MQRSRREGNRIELVAENSAFKLIARAAMLLGSIIGFPLLGYIAQNALFKIDRQSSQISDMSTKLEVLSVTVAAGVSDRYRSTDAARDFALQKVIIESLDHRVTALEKVKR